MRLGIVILPEHRWPVARDVWRRAEQLGLDHAWTYDHLAWCTLRDAPWFGAVPTLAAAATITSRIRLGPLVASPNFRHPVSFARELITLDEVSGATRRRSSTSSRARSESITDRGDQSGEG